MQCNICIYVLRRLIAMMVMEHVLLGFKIMMMYVIDDVPRWIREAIAQRNAQQRTASSAARISKYAAGEHESQTKVVSPKSRAARRTSTTTAAFLHSLSGKPHKGSTHGASPPGSTALAPVASPATSPRNASERDDVSVLTETSEKPLLRQRASNFLHHFTGRSKTHHAQNSSHNSSTGSMTAQGVAVQPVPISTAVQQDPRSDAMLDEIAQLTEHTLGEPADYVQNDEPEFVETFNAPSRETPVDRLVKETASPFGFDPSHMMILICLPLALNYFNITPWLYLPAAVLFFGYLQSKKDRIDRKIAMGIVSDPTLLKLILEEMPSWPIDGEFQQLVSIFYSICASIRLFFYSFHIIKKHFCIYNRSG